MAKSNAFGYKVGQSVDVERTRTISNEYNAASMVYLGVHPVKSVDRWGYSSQPEYVNPNFRGHDLGNVYPLLSAAGVIYQPLVGTPAIDPIEAL